MKDNTKDDRLSVYEIGYLIAASVPEEQIAGSVEKIKKVIEAAGSSIVSEESPRLIDLAYTIRTKNVSGSYEKHDQAHFGWVKFEVSSNKVEAIKKSVEALNFIVRMLLITTVKENTYLGKMAESILEKEVVEEVKKEVAPAASVEDMDKSIDAMVKEA